MGDDELLTTEELARRLKVSKQFIYNLTSPKISVSRRLPSKKIGRLRRFELSEVLKYFEDNLVRQKK